MIDNSSELK